MGQYKISKAGNISGGGIGIPETVRANAQSVAKLYVAGKLTMIDNSGGIANSKNVVKFVSSYLSAAASGSNLATKATIDSAMASVQNGIAVLYSSAAVLAAILGLETLTYNGGGTIATPNTVPSVATTVAGTTVGPSAAAVNTINDNVNGAMYELATLARKITIAIGDPELIIDVTGINAAGGQKLPAAYPNYTVPAFGVVSDTATSTGITAAAAAAALVTFQNNLATISAVLARAATLSPPKVRATS